MALISPQVRFEGNDPQPLGASIRQQYPQQTSAPGFEKNVSGWQEYLERPEVKTALLQFGASMLRPSAGLGDAIGKSVGEASEAVGRLQDRKLRDRELERRNQQQDIENRRADTRLEIDQERLDLERKRVEIADRTARRRGAGGKSPLVKLYDQAEKEYKLQFEQYKLCAEGVTFGDDVGSVCGPMPTPPTLAGLQAEQDLFGRLSRGELTNEDHLRGVEGLGEDDYLSQLQARFGVDSAVVKQARRFIEQSRPADPESAPEPGAPSLTPPGTVTSPTTERSFSPVPTEQLAQQVANKVTQIGRFAPGAPIDTLLDSVIREVATLNRVPVEVVRQAYITHFGDRNAGGATVP